CVDEFEIFGPDDPAVNLALAKRGAKATASSEYPNAPIHKIAHLNDGQYGNGRSWISAENGKGWCQIELPAASTVDRLVWGRDGQTDGGAEAQCDRTAAPRGPGRLDCAPGQPASRPCDGEPLMALAFRSGDRQHSERFRLQRRPPVAPGTARLARGRVPRQRR